MSPPDRALPAVHRGLADRVLRVLRRVLTREVLTFLAVGGTGYVVDVVAFNVLRSAPHFAALDPTIARRGGVRCLVSSARGPRDCLQPDVGISGDVDPSCATTCSL